MDLLFWNFVNIINTIYVITLVLSQFYENVFKLSLVEKIDDFGQQMLTNLFFCWPKGNNLRIVNVSNFKSVNYLTVQVTWRCNVSNFNNLDTSRF